MLLLQKKPRWAAAVRHFGRFRSSLLRRLWACVLDRFPILQLIYDGTKLLTHLYIIVTSRNQSCSTIVNLLLYLRVTLSTHTHIVFHVVRAS